MNVLMNAARVVCLGLAVLDVVQRVETPPEWGTKGVATSVEIVAGGPATNAAIVVAALGMPVTLVTALGDSPQAALVRRECARFGVETLDIATDGWELPVASCIVDVCGERTVVSTGARATEFPLTPQANTALAAADVVLLDGHHPAAAEQALRDRPVSCLAVLDAGSVKPHAEHWLPLLDVLAGSADYASGLGMSNEGALGHALESGARTAVITDGPGSVLWANAGDDAPASVTPPTVSAVDTLGAGDAWHGAFTAALARGRSPEVAVEFASRVASIRVAHVGARAWLGYLDDGLWG